MHSANSPARPTSVPRFFTRRHEQADLVANHCFFWARPLGGADNRHTAEPRRTPEATANLRLQGSTQMAGSLVSCARRLIVSGCGCLRMGAPVRPARNGRVTAASKSSSPASRRSSPWRVAWRPTSTAVRSPAPSTGTAIRAPSTSTPSTATRGAARRSRRRPARPATRCGSTTTPGTRTSPTPTPSSTPRPRSCRRSSRARGCVAPWSSPASCCEAGSGR